MNDISDKKWMKFSLDNVSMRQMLMLDAIHSNAVSVWLRAFTIVKNNGGEMELRVLLPRLTSHSVSRKKVMEIIIATGDFCLDEETGIIAFSDQAMGKMASVSSGKNSRAKGLGRENSPDLNAANAHASSSTIQEREKEKENTDTKKNGKETGEQPAVSELNDPEELPQHDPNYMPTEDGMPQQDPYYTTTADGMPLRDPNYTPSAEVMALVPEQVRRYSDKHWYPFACWLFDEQGMQRWKEALVMQSSNKAFTELVLRHWSETVTSFVEHSYCYGALETVQCKGEILQKLSLYLRPQRKPALILKARLKWMELRNNATDERQLRFYDFMSQHCPNLVAMEQSLSFEEFDRLRQSYGKDAVLKVLLDMENEPKLQKRSCFLTARVWLEHRKDAK